MAHPKRNVRRWAVRSWCTLCIGVAVGESVKPALPRSDLTPCPPSPHVPRLLATNHKSGTFLAGAASRLLCDAVSGGWLRNQTNKVRMQLTSCCAVAIAPHWAGERKASIPKLRVLNFARDPADLIVSGYLYHRDPPRAERWAFQPLMRRESSRRPSIGDGGRNAVYEAILALELPPLESPGETLPHYLCRVAPRDGISAELIRARVTDLPNIVEAVRATRTEGNDRDATVCLGRLMAPDSARSEWTKALQALKVPETKGALLDALVELSTNASRRNGHATVVDDKRDELLRLARDVGGTQLARDARVIDCGASRA